MKRVFGIIFLCVIVLSGCNENSEITYDYDAGEDFVGSGGMSYIDEPKSGIYDLGPSAGESAPR